MNHSKVFLFFTNHYLLATSRYFERDTQSTYKIAKAHYIIYEVGNACHKVGVFFGTFAIDINYVWRNIIARGELKLPIQVHYRTRRKGDALHQYGGKMYTFPHAAHEVLNKPGPPALPVTRVGTAPP